MKRLLYGTIGLIVVLIGVVVVFVIVQKPHNVSNPNISFTATTAKSTPQVTRAPTVRQAENFEWPVYGFHATRDRAFVGQINLRPPFRQGWSLGHNQLLEFPPVIFGHTLFYMDDSATVKAVDSVNGTVRWQHQIGQLSSASPGLAVRQRILIVPTLSDDSAHTPGDGQIIALSMRTGKVIWQHALPSGAEGSPLVNGNTVWYGDQSGTLFSANVSTGHINWTFQAGGAIKGGAAKLGGNLYIDAYGGTVYDINPGDGHKIWEASTGGELGFASGNFYSTPTVAFGRVYVGSTNGFIYSFSASTGQLAWSYGTGNYVYSSAAVANVPKLGPTVYMGSYNGDFYAFNARSGKVRWVHRDRYNDRISGSATVVDDIVYYSDLDDKSTTGLDASTGKVVFNFPDGAFSPVVADEGHIYLSGGYVLYQLTPKQGLGQALAARKPTTAATHTVKTHTAKTHTDSRRATAVKRTAARQRAATRAHTTTAHATRQRAARTHRRHN